MNRPNDEQITANSPAPKRRGINFKLAAVALTLVSALFGTCLANLLKQREPAPQDARFVRLFREWDKPDLVLLLTAQQHGYMMPCGCSKPQLGGLERRYNFMQLLRAHGWPVVGIDLGDVPQKRGPANLSNLQALIKYRYSMMAMKEMDYLGVGIGEYEGALSLAKVEGDWAANEEKPAILVGNLKDQKDTFPFLKALEARTVPGANIRVGVTNIVGRTVANNFPDKSVKFNPSKPALDEMVKQMKTAKVDLPVLLYHGVATGEKEALNCAKFYPQFPVILCLSEEDEPPSDPIPVDHPESESKTRNYIFRLGHKGKYVGALGVFRNGKGDFEFKYRLVELGPEYETPEGQKDNQPILKMWEQYARELKDKNYLKSYGQSQHLLQAMNEVPGLRNAGKPQYIGSQACGKCHDDAYMIWQNSPHSHAYMTLEQARHPSLRQYDAECIVCHTVGFGYQTGYVDEGSTAKLKNVGCESCHGPGSLHAKNPENLEWRARMNQPWRGAANEKAKNLAIEKLCVSCHDIDNDVNWVHTPTKDPFVEKWVGKKIIHNKPKDE